MIDIPGHLTTAKGSKHDDTFGMNDDDWNVYLTIVSTAHIPAV